MRSNQYLRTTVWNCPHSFGHRHRSQLQQRCMDENLHTLACQTYPQRMWHWCSCGLCEQCSGMCVHPTVTIDESSTLPSKGNCAMLRHHVLRHQQSYGTSPPLRALAFGPSVWIRWFIHHIVLFTCMKPNKATPNSKLRTTKGKNSGVEWRSMQWFVGIADYLVTCCAITCS